MEFISWNNHINLYLGLLLSFNPLVRYHIFSHLVYIFQISYQNSLALSVRIKNITVMYIIFYILVVARGPPSYIFKFYNVILYTFINNNTSKNIEMSMCCKGVKDSRDVGVCWGVHVQLMCHCCTELVRYW